MTTAFQFKEDLDRIVVIMLDRFEYGKLKLYLSSRVPNEILEELKGIGCELFYNDGAFHVSLPRQLPCSIESAANQLADYIEEQGIKVARLYRGIVVSDFRLGVYYDLYRYLNK